MKVSAGTKIDVLINCEITDMRYTPYGDYGRASDLAGIEG